MQQIRTVSEFGVGSQFSALQGLKINLEVNLLIENAKISKIKNNIVL